MQELGFQACCLRCDAPDEVGLERCSSCIQHHRSVRETLASAPPDDPLYQLAKEVMAMAAAPHRYDHDEVHGEVLIEQQRLAGSLSGPRQRRTEDDVVRVFDEQRAAQKANVLRDVGNKNPWKNAAPSADEANAISQQTWALEGQEIDPHYGARTVPSKPIQAVDRSERTGEDTELTDRVHAAVSSSGLDEDVAEIFEELEFKQRQSQRAALKEAMEDIKEMVDDDLEF
jgi:hypothetical protein